MVSIKELYSSVFDWFFDDGKSTTARWPMNKAESKHLTRRRVKPVQAERRKKPARKQRSLREIKSRSR
jgi:hypothetical protein